MAKTKFPSWQRVKKFGAGAKGYGRIVVGVPGICPQRALMTKWFPEGLHVVSMDDDVKDTHYVYSNSKLERFFLTSIFSTSSGLLENHFLINPILLVAKSKAS